MSTVSETVLAGEQGPGEVVSVPTSQSRSKGVLSVPEHPEKCLAPSRHPKDFTAPPPSSLQAVEMRNEIGRRKELKILANNRGVFMFTFTDENILGSLRQHIHVQEYLTINPISLLQLHNENLMALRGLLLPASSISSFNYNA